MSSQQTVFPHAAFCRPGRFNKNTKQHLSAFTVRCSYHDGGWTSFLIFKSHCISLSPGRDLFIPFAHIFFSSEICSRSFKISGDSPFAELCAFFPGFHLFFLLCLCKFPLFVWHAQAVNIFVCLFVFLPLLASLSICYFIACGF